jgi:hypothetical protein
MGELQRNREQSCNGFAEVFFAFTEPVPGVMTAKSQNCARAHV